MKILLLKFTLPPPMCNKPTVFQLYAFLFADASKSGELQQDEYAAEYSYLNIYADDKSGETPFDSARRPTVEKVRLYSTSPGDLSRCHRETTDRELGPW